MVHVGVGEQQQIEGWQLASAERRLDETPRTELGATPADPDTALERRIREDPAAEQVEEHRRVTQPGSGQAVVRPGLGCRAIRRGSNLGAALAPPLPDQRSGRSGEPRLGGR